MRRTLHTLASPSTTDPHPPSSAPACPCPACPSGALLPLAGEGFEAFGQSENLCRRLRGIAEAYPETAIPVEMLQNAEDAGASVFKLLLFEGEFGRTSLLGPGLAEFAGPALYVYNDAQFTERDYANIARIGQGSKLEKLATAGRFGLGFNAVYGLTDVPQFVSGSSVVLFDPHASHVPGATAAQPGLRIQFAARGGGASGGLLRQFPDSFSPYLFFGCVGAARGR